MRQDRRARYTIAVDRSPSAQHGRPDFRAGQPDDRAPRPPDLHRARQIGADRTTTWLLRTGPRSVDDLCSVYIFGGNPMQDGLSAPVIGPSAILPRGYLWQTPIWYLLAAGALALSHWPPTWFRVTAAVGLLGAMIVLLFALNAITTHAFAADHAGVRLGLPAGSRRRGRKRRGAKYLPWQQIERVRIAPKPYGARVELMLGPNASLALRGFRHSALWAAWRWVLLMIPFWYLLRPTALTSPLDGPPRYRVNVRGLSVDELRTKLRAVAPPDVAVAVLVRKR